MDGWFGSQGYFASRLVTTGVPQGTVLGCVTFNMKMAECLLVKFSNATKLDESVNTLPCRAHRIPGRVKPPHEVQ